MYANTLTALASALPAPTAGTCSGTHEVINFDNISPQTLPVETTSNTTTGGLFFQAFTALSTQNLASGVKAHSPNNVAGVGGVQEMLNGNAMVTMNFPGSTTKSFDVNSVYFGCYLSANAGANTAQAPQACIVSMTGYQGSDNSVANAKQVCSYTVNYNPSTNVGLQQLSFSKQFPSACKKLNFLVIFFQIQPQTVNAAQERLVLSIDDFDTNIYKC